jgi:GNAT superfamily N-acetyltransferase
MIQRLSAIHLSELKAISRITFEQSFAAQNNASDMREYLENNLSDAKLKTELENAESEFYFIHSENIPVGYLKLNLGNTQSEKFSIQSLEIERLYVLKSEHGKKYGHRLLNFAVTRAIELNCKQVWLGVWEKNFHAIDFYEKHGFVPFGHHLFKLGADEQTDILMRLHL